MNFRGFAAALVAGAGALGTFATGAASQDDNVFKLALVTFLSGPAAEMAGKPSEQAVKTVIDALNAGGLQALRQDRLRWLEDRSSAH